MTKPIFAYAKIKAQTSSTVSAQMITALFALQRLYNPTTSLILNIKFLTIFCGCTVQFELDLVRNPDDRFSYDVTYMLYNNVKYLFTC